MCAPGKSLAVVVPKEALCVATEQQKMVEAQEHQDAAPNGSSTDDIDNKPKTVRNNDHWMVLAACELLFPQLRTPLAFLGI